MLFRSGPTGLIGSLGATGLRGQPGLPGEPGNKGDMGVSGAQGVYNIVTQSCSPVSTTRTGKRDCGAVVFSHRCDRAII